MVRITARHEKISARYRYQNEELFASLGRRSRLLKLARTTDLSWSYDQLKPPREECITKRLTKLCSIEAVGGSEPSRIKIYLQPESPIKTTTCGMDTKMQFA
ncbi:hypothetical protein AAHA92_12547 [Salvia divinorum]|uniref:Uncharacterized protein n=1 Tax=Salvia divinorum TaxID=28513 RepID=A0ABD1HNY9_SALDI